MLIWARALSATADNYVTRQAYILPEISTRNYYEACHFSDYVNIQFTQFANYFNCIKVN